jgi:DNA polymerase
MMATMSNEYDELTAAARQLIAIEELLGGQYIPRRGSELPDVVVARAPEPASASAAPAAEAAQPPAGASMTREEKVDALTAMDCSEVQGCRKCPLCESRTNTVFGEVNPDADLVFVGEAPGQDEDLSGRPFVGRAGQLLDKMIAAMGISREDVFICNVVKCRPPNNRTPAPEEVTACWGYLVRQLQIIAPKCIVTLGNPSTRTLLNTRTGITRMRGSWASLPDIGEGLAGTPVMPTFHPAYVLRQYTTDNRRKVWSDLKQVMDMLGLEAPSRG